MADSLPSNTYHLSANVPDADHDTQEVGGGYTVAGGVEGDYMAKHEDNLSKTAPATLVTTVTKKEPKQYT